MHAGYINASFTFEFYKYPHVYSLVRQIDHVSFIKQVKSTDKMVDESFP